MLAAAACAWTDSAANWGGTAIDVLDAPAGDVWDWAPAWKTCAWSVAGVDAGGGGAMAVQLALTGAAPGSERLDAAGPGELERFDVPLTTWLSWAPRAVAGCVMASAPRAAVVSAGAGVKVDSAGEATAARAGRVDFGGTGRSGAALVGSSVAFGCAMETGAAPLIVTSVERSSAPAGGAPPPVTPAALDACAPAGGAAWPPCPSPALEPDAAVAVLRTSAKPVEPGGRPADLIGEAFSATGDPAGGVEATICAAANMEVEKQPRRQPSLTGGSPDSSLFGLIL